MAVTNQNPNAPLFDAWTALSFKRVLGNRARPGTTYMLPTWTGTHARRLMAYQMLQAYIDNAGRHYLGDPNDTAKEQHREYGDAALVRDQVLSALLGEEQHVVTERASEFKTDLEEDNTEGGTEPGQADPAAVAADTEADPEVVAAWEFQEWINDWTALERFPLKMIETERNAVGLGDGVYSVGWNTDKTRVRLRVWDPGFYFPVLDDGNEDDYPAKVHIAWELEQPLTGPNADKTRIRRITWELVPVEPWTPAYQDEQADVMCVMSDGIFFLDQGRPDTVDALTEARVEWNKTTVDGQEVDFRLIEQNLDFIPVIHEPNTVALLEHFGQSSLAKVMQVLDDISNADTDLNAASATTGNPVITITGASLGNDEKGEPKRLTYRPGEVIETGDGKMDALDTSKSLTALDGYLNGLLSRLSVNARLPEALLGRVKPSEVPSGVALALSFGPLKAMISEMRLVRNEKYPLLFKMVWRISLTAGAENVPKTYHPTTLEFGSFLPSDEAGAVSMVKELLSVKPLPAISLETAIQILINAGMPVEDAAEEVRKIEERAFEQATMLLDALGSEEEVAKFLNRDVPPALPSSGSSGGAGGAPVITPPPGVPVQPEPRPGEVVPPPTQ